MTIGQSAEDYLEAILMLKETKGYARSIDISRELGVTKPSVSNAVKNLRENGYITMEAGGLLDLTEKGYNIAKSVLDRHNLLTEFFISIGVSEETAREDACKMEHGISTETFEALCKHADWKSGRE